MVPCDMGGKGADMHLRLSPERRLIMSFVLRQSLQILQMPQMELGVWLRSEIERNPLLELKEKAKPRFSLDSPAQKSLHEYIQEQMRENFSTSQQRAQATALLEQIDEKGFLPPDTPNSPLLQTLQTFNPPGIFARNLQESLLLQLP